jgi:hypothetical protein
MLSDAEQRKLAEIERSLIAEDPRLARRFSRPWRSRRRPTAALVLIVLMSWIVVVSALASGSVAVAMLGLIALIVTVSIWVGRRHS